MYDRGKSYAEIGRKLSISRQRVHQIVRGYKNTGRQGRKKKYKSIALCAVCSVKASCLHHIDFNNENDSKSNLLPLCRSCHYKIHRGRKREGKIKNLYKIPESFNGDIVSKW